ncbi:uncharacterized protein LOC108665712 [Hyalella azteca]|uniref:Uncharacterized protein LOC108665712 n=1 Tax=Hyalella azteca TaxID=294128 RepID=A0A8B7N3L9_HYAAZ|nr:uncharacterized protein LOC108665712 [Hyalella azteca]
MSGQVIPYDVPPCTIMTFTLTPSFGKTSGVPVNADCITPDVPDVDNLSIDTFVFNTSFVVHFTPTCPGVFTYNLLNGGSSVPSEVEPNAAVAFAVQPCTTYSTFTLQPVNPNGTDAGTAIPVPTLTTSKCVCMTSYVALSGSQVAIYWPDLTEVKTSGEVARAKPVTAVPHYGNRVPGNAVDGNNQTRFHSDDTGAYPKPWLIIDLMSTVLVTKVRVLPFVGTWPQRVTDLRVGLGNSLPPTAMDFSQYEVVGAIDGPVPMEEKWYEFEVSPPRCSRYVAIYKIVERVYDIYIMELAEMEVFAEY